MNPIEKLLTWTVYFIHTINCRWLAYKYKYKYSDIRVFYSVLQCNYIITKQLISDCKSNGRDLNEALCDLINTIDILDKANKGKEI